MLYFVVSSLSRTSGKWAHINCIFHAHVHRQKRVTHWWTLVDVCNTFFSLLYNINQAVCLIFIWYNSLYGMTYDFYIILNGIWSFCESVQWTWAVNLNCLHLTCIHNWFIFSHDVNFVSLLNGICSLFESMSVEWTIVVYFSKTIIFNLSP